MSNSIDFFGIETNNLKNIDVSLIKYAINLIVGPSGSGKSSLAYDTIAKIGQYELNSMFSDISFEPDYKIRSYSDILVTIPIKQTNNNHNMHSTIGTYFHMNQHVAMIYSVILNLPYSYFILNREENLCPICHGFGYLKELDINRLVDYDVPLEKLPIKCWTRYKDFYIEITKMFCKDMGIDYKKNFRLLTEKEKNIFLYGESKKKYSISFNKLGMRSKRTTKFFGIMTNIPMMSNFSPNKDFFTDKICPACNGEKYSNKYRENKLMSLSIGELMSTSFSFLKEKLKSFKNIAEIMNLDFQLNYIINFINKAVELNLGHLFFNRTIPSLSGGELQRLRLVQVFSTQLSDLLIVLDEPLAGLSGIEKKIVYNNIKCLADKHTILIVDHHNIFYKDAAKIISLGIGSGQHGGNIIDTKSYLESEKIKNDYFFRNEQKLLSNIIISNNVYEYSGVDIKIAISGLNFITGNSGVGKSTLLREYFSQYFEKYCYISQKPLMGNSYSTVSSVLNIYNIIISNFGTKFNKGKNYFSNSFGCDGTCPSCNGSGYAIYGNEYQNKVRIICKNCYGTGFNPKLNKYKIEGKSIFDIWKMTIDEAYLYYNNLDSKITSILSEAKEIMLGHLQIGQKTETLSGGENIRIKILKHLKETCIVYGIDEPFRGLNNFEIYTLVVFFNKFVDKKKTVIIVDHEEESFKYFNPINILVNLNGKLSYKHL